jgi:putative transcriptional regulator
MTNPDGRQQGQLAFSSRDAKHARKLAATIPGPRLKITPVTTPTINLTDHFLIAMPAMADPNFARTLTYIAEHNENGAIGVIVNRPIDMRLGHLFERIDIPLEHAEFAGPARVFRRPGPGRPGLRAASPGGDWHSTLKVRTPSASPAPATCCSRLATDGEPKVLVALGYAGWSAGQLEHEMAQNAWLTVPADLSGSSSTCPPKNALPPPCSCSASTSPTSDVAGHA